MPERISAALVTALAWGLIALMLLIGLQTLSSLLDINPLARFETALPLLGKAITLNSLLDAQWHLLVITGLLPCGLLWLRDSHIRVDFLYGKRSLRTRKIIDLVGHLLFALPFFVLILPASLAFVARAWRSGEGSRNGGLNDLWLIKAALPLGLGLLAVAVLVEAGLLLRRLLRGAP